MLLIQLNTILYFFSVVEEGSASDKRGHVVKHEVSQDESSAEANLDPKIRKGLERIRKLDAILADKLKVSNSVYKKRLRLLTGLPRSGKSQGKTNNFQGQGKVREFCKRSGKILEVCRSQ